MGAALMQFLDFVSLTWHPLSTPWNFRNLRNNCVLNVYHRDAVDVCICRENKDAGFFGQTGIQIQTQQDLGNPNVSSTKHSQKLLYSSFSWLKRLPLYEEFPACSNGTYTDLWQVFCSSVDCMFTEICVTCLTLSLWHRFPRDSHKSAAPWLFIIVLCQAHDGICLFPMGP